jgi:Immunity protein Imm1
MDKSTYFDSYWGPGWPDEKWLERYFLTPQGRKDFFASGNDGWGLTAEGVDGTDHLPHLKGRVDVNLTIQGHRDLGILLQYRKTGRRPIETYYSKSDLSRLHQWVKTAHDDRMPIGLFIPFETAWKAIKEFMESNAALPKSIAWVKSSDIPAGTFPPP